MVLESLSDGMMEWEENGSSDDAFVVEDSATKLVSKILIPAIR